jgi:ankyrin repeat protein
MIVRAAMERAVRAGDVRALESELSAVGSVDSLDSHGQTALMLAAHAGHQAIVECLLRHGANLDVRAKFGLSALMLAIVAGHEAVARTLVAAGANLTLQGSGAPGFAGKTAADLAAEQGMTELCGLIDAQRTTQ